GCHRNVANVLCSLEEADSSNDVALYPKFKIVGANIRVAVGNRCHHLRHGDVEGDELVRVEINVKLFGRPSETDYVNDARYLLELPFENPILRHLEIHQAVTLSGELITVDFADG